MENRVDRLAAWVAALLPGSCAATLPAIALFADVGIVALPFAVGTMLLVGLPYALIARRCGRTGWTSFLIAGFSAGIVPLIPDIVESHLADRPMRLFVPLAFLSGLIGAGVFRTMLKIFQLIDHQHTVAPHRPPSPWPVMTILVILTGLALFTTRGALVALP